VRILLRELNDTLAAHYAQDQRHGLLLVQLFQPSVRFFIAHLDEMPVACGGIALCDGYAEVKRMYVRPAARGRGIAKALLTRLAAEACAAHRLVLRLETGIHQTEAIALYERFGFVRCASFGPYAAMPPNAVALSVFFELKLSAP
jgi:ribosomal protein S18 acetylase RimI-like enzyme